MNPSDQTTFADLFLTAACIIENREKTSSILSCALCKKSIRGLDSWVDYRVIQYYKYFGGIVWCQQCRKKTEDYDEDTSDISDSD